MEYEYQPQTHFNLCRVTRDQNSNPIGCSIYLPQSMRFSSIYIYLLDGNLFDSDYSRVCVKLWTGP